jgi:hypothetical protein
MSANKNYMMNNPSLVLLNKITTANEYTTLNRDKAFYKTTVEAAYNKVEGIDLGTIYSNGNLQNILRFQSDYLLPVICPILNNSETIIGTNEFIERNTNAYTNYNAITNIKQTETLVGIVQSTGISFPPLNIIK